MTKKKKEELLKNYELLFPMFQEVARSNFNYGMSITSQEDREKANKAETDFIHMYVDIEKILEEL